MGSAPSIERSALQDIFIPCVCISAAMIKTSWKRILLLNETDPNGIKISGQTSFTRRFFTHLDNTDPEYKINRCLCTNSHQGEEVSEQVKRDYLMRFMRFILTIDNDYRKVRLKLRALGRRHALRKSQEYIEIIVNIILLTISEHLGLSMSDRVMQSWADVMLFVCRQMCEDKLQLHPDLHWARVGQGQGQSCGEDQDEYQDSLSATVSLGRDNNAANTSGDILVMPSQHALSIDYEYAYVDLSNLVEGQIASSHDQPSSSPLTLQPSL